ncbi:MAG: molybdenum ABC transporter ATP-binding protein [Mesorhizobium sp.]|nr:molybdenum ABC transporter ATP-binding protein [Mesorhizobium sp.]
MSISVEISQRLGAFQLDAGFESAGRLTALFGPSGSGKTSVINAIGGLTRPTEARIVVDGRVLVDTAARSFLPAHRRRIGYVFQDARLFPHLSVAQNLRYGRFFTPKTGRYADFDGIVDLLGIAHLLERMPGQLSGGEKQRVAIGRALIASPRLILMDEPLAALDEARKAEILPYIERLRDETGVPIVYVSHAIGEVTRLATDIVVMSQGRVIASGTAGAVMSDPKALRAMGLREIGSSLPAVIEAQEDDGLTRLRAAAGPVWLPRVEGEPGTAVSLRIMAHDVIIASEKPTGISALNMLPATVTAIDSGDGAGVIVRLDVGGSQILAQLTARSVRVLALAPGTPCFAVVKSMAVARDDVRAAPAK